MPKPRPSTEDAKNLVPTLALGDLVKGTVLTHYVQRQNPRGSEEGPRPVGPGRATRGGGRDRELPAEAGAQICSPPTPHPTHTRITAERLAGNIVS